MPSKPFKPPRLLLIVVLLICACASFATRGQVNSPSESNLGRYTNLPAMICGDKGVAEDITELPPIGCFVLQAGRSAVGNFEGHRFTVEISAHGIESCRLDDQAVSCGGCVVSHSNEWCRAKIQVISRAPDGTVLFDMAQNIGGNGYVTNKKNYDLELKRKNLAK